MRISSLTLAVSSLLLSCPVSSKADCRRGTLLTVAGEIKDTIQFKNYWWITPDRKIACIAFIVGARQIPSGCVKGGKFNVSGRIGGAVAGVFPEGTADHALAVSRISCRAQ